MRMEDFDSIVYSIVREIPSGKVITYGKIAALAGKPQWSRRVGHAMSCAPRTLQLPCHRVVNSQGRLVPDWQEQRSLLEKKGVTFRPNGSVDLKRNAWEDVLF